ncbi:DMT family transporter [Billgrantia kenyensis]|uniref:DMT family transporter n=1 Tax=Billgrantia kenyensis TaxID=321266 RepID=A0A7V9W4A2_9GAMM|nr:DMT family transporter [Halomonas kenyensis]MBA2780778.1 DMT family transporter [Halomonas kenyensis]MCG6663603.1 DMT family transporter [Halomonas kenyensis]
MTNSTLSSNRTGWYALGCLLLVGSLLALSLAVAKLADDAGAPRLGFLMVAVAGAGVLLLALAAVQRQPMKLDRRIIEYALVSGALFALPNALGFLAVRHVGAGFVSLSFAFPILVTWMLAVGLGMERMNLLRLSGVLLGLSGGVLLAWAKAGGMSGAQGWVVLVLAIPLIIALGNIYRTLRWPGEAGPVYLAALMMLGGALALAPFVLAFEARQFAQLLGSGDVIRLLLAEVAVFTVLYVFYFVLQKIAGPVYLSQIGMVAALVGTLVAVLLLGESVPPFLGLAGVLVALGAGLFHRGASQHTSPPTLAVAKP